ncbi:hypothetical protein LAZ67_21002317 [Cordylochernes scorpioides]|uniref:Mos1 transposase HTH domain-containing protein n=1 Tax=Cordylochernes scorpioides TaxID=51811 RepID=A0ABY6LMQ6_9ARAC|nr:hypothetical protein LAZ67_21002317 [Cordylochernes scorpioides]
MEDQRICIKFCVKNGFKGAEIFWMLQTAYGDAVMSRRRVFEWYKRFKEGREETADNERSGRPFTSTTPEKMDKVLELVREDRRITVREVAEEAEISLGSQSIMKDILGVRRLNAVLVPKDLTFDQKNARKETASLNLEATTDDPKLLKRVITGDETWIYGFDSETTQQASEWRFKNEPSPKKARKAPSKVKVMLTVFFDYQSIVHYQFQQQKRPELWRSKSWILHHDNALAQTALKISKMADQPVSSAELKKLRTPVRARFTKAFNELETEIKKKEVKKADVEKILRRLQTHHEKLSILNMRMEEALLRESASEDIFTAEYESVCEYEDNFSSIMTDYEALAEKDDVSTISGTAAMNYRLPKLEFKKFGGEPREWITFWSRFSTIDRDPQIPPETKFQYLFQATAENSEAREAVESFPPSADNYPKVIEYIKSRFGEDEMLVEIYVRDLLQNVRAEGKMSVVKLYDRLETQLRALETLGVARDKFAAMLYPLVESALPVDTLRVWERSQYTVSGRGVQDKGTQLMTFLKTEVKGESRVNMAKAAFKIDNNQDAKDDRSNRKSLSKKNTGSKMPTATDLANTTQMRNNCIFCGNGHPSQECYSGQRMHLPEKKYKAKGKNVCFWCLLPGHGFKKCRIKPRCPVCGGKHYPIMCPTLEARKTSHLQKAGLKVSRESPATKQETANQFTSTTLNNATVGGVYLQTLIVKISGPKGKHNVRVLLDCGSQRSYISKRMVDALGLKRVQQVTLTHNLFGGGEIRQKKHNVYKVNVSSLNNEYMDDLKFLDQEVICGHISQVQDHTILNELKARGINLTDICQGEEISIHMLIGSDLLSSILTGRMQILQNGVVATVTKLGWTVMGPAIGKDMEDLLGYVIIPQQKMYGVNINWIHGFPPI